MENFTFYIVAIIAIIVGIFLIKKFVGCLVRSAITLIIIAIIAFLYWNYCS